MKPGNHHDVQGPSQREDSLDTAVVKESVKRYSQSGSMRTPLRDVSQSIIKNQEDQLPSIPGYRLLRELGEGGMGKVWLAEQDSLAGRQVAVKLIRRESPSPEFITRFIREGKSMALLNHPNIAKILDAGCTDDQCPFMVVELVHGQPLVKYCDEKRLNIRDRLQLFQRVCDGVQHAHSRGLIHRDLKPSNILVTEVDEVPDPKIIDFGLVKAIDSPSENDIDTQQTQLGHVLGSYLYMSPEQASAGELGVDIRSDVFSLGAILHELVVGSTPVARDEIDGLSPLAILSAIQNFEPMTPSTRLREPVSEYLDNLQNRNTPASALKSALEEGLDWVILKSIDSEANRRYVTVNALSADIQRFLNDEPVEAVPPSTLYRLKKFVRRNRVLAASAFAISFSIIAGLVSTSVFALVANQAKKDAVQRGVELDDLLTKRNTKLANVLIDENRNPESHHYLEQIPESSQALEYNLLRERAQGGLLTYHPTSLLDAIELAFTGSSLWSIGGDRQSLTMTGFGESFQVVNQPLDDREATLLYQVPHSVLDVGAVALSRDARLFVFSQAHDQVKVVNLQESKTILDLSQAGNPEDFIFTKSARYLAWKCQGVRPQFKVVDLQSGDLVFAHTDETEWPRSDYYDVSSEKGDFEAMPPAPGEPGSDSDSAIPPLLAPSPDEGAPAPVTEFESHSELDNTAELLFETQEKPKDDLAEGLAAIMENAFEDAGRAMTESLAEGMADIAVGMFDGIGDIFESLFTAFDIDGVPMPKVIAIAEDGDRALFAISTNMSTVQVWDTHDRSLVFESPVFESMVSVIELSPNAKQLFVALGNSTVHIISLEDNSDYQVLRMPNHTPCTTLEFSDDSSYCLMGSSGGNLYRYICKARAITETFSGHHRAISTIRIVSGDRVAASQSVDGIIKFWELAPQSKAPAFPTDQFSDRVVTSTVSFSGDGRFFAIGSGATGASLYAANDYSSPKTFFTGLPPVTHLKLNVDGSLLAAGFKDSTCMLIDTQTGETLFEYTDRSSDPNLSYADPYAPKTIQSLDFSTNGESLLIVTEAEIALIDVAKKKVNWTKAGSWFSGTFDPAGNLIYVQKLNDNLRSLLVQLDTRDGSEKQLVDIPRNHMGGTVCMAGPNELYILQQRMREASTIDTIRGFDIRTMAQISTIPTGIQLDTFQCTADGSRVLTRDIGGKVNLWDPKSGEEVFSMSINKTITGMALNPDMSRLVIAYDDGYWNELFIDSEPQQTKIFTNTDTEQFVDVSPRWHAFYTRTESGFNTRSSSNGSLLKTWKSPETRSERSRAHLLPSETKTTIIFDDLDQGTFSLWDFESNKLLGNYSYEVSRDDSPYSIDFAFDEASMSLIRCSHNYVELWDLRTHTKEIFTDEGILGFNLPFFAEEKAYVYGTRSEPSGKIVGDWHELPSGAVAKEPVSLTDPMPVTTSPDGTQSLALEGDNLVLVDREYFEKPVGKLRLIRLKHLVSESN